MPQVERKMVAKRNEIKRESKGTEGGGGKDKGNNGPDGVCYNCGRDQYASNSHKAGKGGNVKVVALCPVSTIPLHNRYDEFREEDDEETQEETIIKENRAAADPWRACSSGSGDSIAEV